MNEAHTDIDQKIREDLDAYEGWPPGTERKSGANWDQLEALLDEKKEQPKIAWTWMAAAAAVVLLAVLGVVRWNQEVSPDDRIVFTDQGAMIVGETGEEEWLTIVESDPRNEGLIYQTPPRGLQQKIYTPPPPPPQNGIYQVDVVDKANGSEITEPRLEAGEVFKSLSHDINTPVTVTPKVKEEKDQNGLLGKESGATYSWTAISSRDAANGTGTVAISDADKKTVVNKFESQGTTTGKKEYKPQNELNLAFTGATANGNSTPNPGAPLRSQVGTTGEFGYFTKTQQETVGGEGHYWNRSKGLETSMDSIVVFDEIGWTNYAEIIENPFIRPFDEALSTFSIDVDHAAYSNMRRYITDQMAPPPDAIRIEELVNYFDYDYKAPPSEGKVPFNLVSEISDCPWTPEHKLVHLGIQGKDIETEDLPASNLVFLVDVSGSMSDENKLPLLKESFKLLVGKMRPQDNVSMVVYAGAAGVVLKPTPGNKKAAILKALDRLESGGSTAGGEGIELAYKLARENFLTDGNNRVILATDGDFNVGISSDEGLEKLIEERRKDGVFLSILGFGTGNYQDAKMQTLADKGNGNHYYIDNLTEAKKVLVTEFGGTLFTIAKDVKIQVEFNPALVESYRLIGYENRMLAAEDFDNDVIDAGELGAGHTVTALYEIVPASEGIAKNEAGRLTESAVSNHEWLTLKLRYKEPDGEKSKLIRKPLREAHRPLASTSNNYRWSAAVAGFGLILRHSQYRGKATYPMILKLAEGAKGPDTEGYREEFVRLVKSMKVLDEMQAVQKDYEDIWGN